VRVLLVNPGSSRSIWSLDGVPGFFGARALMPNPALATLAALTPPGADVQYTLCDEAVGPVAFDQPCDLAAVTGMTADAPRIQALCDGFRARGIPVALGGPFATLEPERAGRMADHHFIGEAEHTWPEFLEQWPRGKARATYRQPERVDLTRSPAPDWSICAPEDYVQVGVQTSRGCPNRCDFCDVVQYVGRRYRTKTIAQVLHEVEAASALGFRGVTLSDDNFVANPRRTVELLRALARWNRGRERPVTFSTQATMQVADHDEVLALMAEAGFRFLFLGLESLREEGLRQVSKVQNLEADPAERLRRIVRHGLVPFLGIIVGFDADDEGVFEELERFIQQSAAPIVASSLLNAPPGTPLHRALEAQGRLAAAEFSGEWQLSSNMVYQNFEGDTLRQGNLDFLARVYSPEVFGARLQSWVERVEHLPEPAGGPPSDFFNQTASLLEFARASFTPDAFRMFRATLKRTLKERPLLLPAVIDILGQYWHFHNFVRRNTAGD